MIDNKIYMLSLFIVLTVVCIYLIGIRMRENNDDKKVMEIMNKNKDEIILDMKNEFDKEKIELNNKEILEQKKIQEKIKKYRNPDDETSKQFMNLYNDDNKLANSDLCEPKAEETEKKIIDLSSPVLNGKEVYFVGPSKYSYSEAKGVCDKLGSRLATKDEIEKSQKSGANWCEYGWAEGQEAYFVSGKDHHKLMGCRYKQNPCGDSAGVHGGKFFNKNLKFGATCYGSKPKMSDKKMKEYEEKKKLLKKEYGTLYKPPTSEELKAMEEENYKKFVEGLKNEQLVNEIYEFNDYKNKWNRYE